MNDRLESIIFKFVDEPANNVSFEIKSGGFFDTYEAESKFNLSENKKTYLLKIEVIPKNKESYESLVYSLNLQSSEKAIKMPLLFAINNKVEPDGTSLQVNVESAVVLIQSKFDIMKTVRIAIKDVDDINCEINALQNQQGKTFMMLNVLSH